MIKQLAHICIHTEDLDATRRFYCDALGMRKGFDFIRDGKPFGYYLQCGQQTFIEVFKGKPAEVGNINHLALQVEDMDALRHQIESQGYHVGPKKMGADQSWQCWLEDPNGTRIELHEYTAQSRQIIGGVCEVNW